MDTTVTDNISAVMSAVWTKLYATTPSGLDYAVDPALWMGYGGAALALFLSVYGAYTAGAAAIAAVESSYFAFLEEF
jgi:hypothetical protein